MVSRMENPRVINAEYDFENKLGVIRYDGNSHLIVKPVLIHPFLRTVEDINHLVLYQDRRLAAFLRNYHAPTGFWSAGRISQQNFRTFWDSAITYLEGFPEEDQARYLLHILGGHGWTAKKNLADGKVGRLWGKHNFLEELPADIR